MKNRTRQNDAPGYLSALAACAAFGAVATAQAEDIQESDAGTSSKEHFLEAIEPTSFTLEPSVSLVAGFYYPTEFCPEPRLGAGLEVPDVALLYTPGVSLFSSIDRQAPLALNVSQLRQTDNFIDRLAELETLEILPLLRTSSASVYFGINREGRLGMHLNSRDSSQ